MTYELQDELYKAGFPGILKYEEGFSHITLEELIEACGGNFVKLEQVLYTFQWRAFGLKYEKFGDADKFGNCYTIYTDGFSTPKEAVAKLWLALNQK